MSGSMLKERLVDAPPTGRPTVLLCHELPDGSRHVDWMIARDPRGRGRLITFRLPGRVDNLPDGERMNAQEIGLHRSVYLEYEGPVSRGRGRVERLRAGRVVSWDKQPDLWTLEVLWERDPGNEAASRRQRLRLERQKVRQWVVWAGNLPDSAG